MNFVSAHHCLRESFQYYSLIMSYNSLAGDCIIAKMLPARRMFVLGLSCNSSK